MPPSRHRRRRADRRSSRRTPPIAVSGGFRSRWLLVSFAVIAGLFILALLAPVVLPLNFGGFGGGGTGSADGYVEGIGESLEVAASRDHFPDNLTITAINPDGYTVPPTSGQHWNGWVQCGFYRDAVPDERIVHNMEHGNIIVHYNLADPAQIDELAKAFDDIGMTNLWGVARPYNPGVDADGNELFPEGTIALTTWGVRDQWNVREVDDADNYRIVGVDKDRMERFFEAYSGKLGPEFPNGAPCTQGGVMSPAS